uniref:Uncharacterized protein n=1 Tax=Sphaerodactylus townsendi TaxID=933632 RepID=A0ACB8FG74_9SAUR
MRQERPGSRGNRRDGKIQGSSRRAEETGNKEAKRSQAAHTDASSRPQLYKEGGEALLILLPSEEKEMLQQLLQKKVPINKIKINPEKIVDIQKKMQSSLAQDQGLKERAQRGRLETITNCIQGAVVVRG